MDSILKKGTTLGQACQSFPQEVDDKVREILRPSSRIIALERTNKWVKNKRQLFYYLRNKETQEKLLILLNTVKHQPKPSAQYIYRTISHILIDKIFYLLVRQGFFCYRANNFFRLREREHSAEDIKLAKEFYISESQFNFKALDITQIISKLHLQLSDHDIGDMLKKDFEYRLDKAETLKRDYIQFNLEINNVIKDVVKFKSNTMVLNEVNRWLLTHRKWFYMNPMKKYIGVNRVIKSRNKLRKLHKIITDRLKTADHPLLHRIRHILPRKIEDLPLVLKCQVFKFLPTNISDEVKKYLSEIK